MFVGLIFIVLVLLIIAAFLSASETAVTASSRIKLHHLKKKGIPRAAQVLDLQLHMGKLISAILLANTWMIAASTALATGIFTSFFGTVGAAYAALFMGAFMTIYVEVMPKIYVYTHAESSAMFLAPFLKALMWVLRPITHIVDVIARESLRLFGVKLPPLTSITSTLEELRGAIELHTGEGPAIAERAMLKSVLDLARVEVADIMVHRNHMFAIDLSLPVEEAVQKIMDAPYTRVPLWEGDPDNIIGILHTKALFRALKVYALNMLDLRRIAAKPWFIPETTTLFEQLQSFRVRHEHIACVVDEYGSLLGIVTLEDILEEIVGEIVDEHDVEIPGVRMTLQKEYVVNGNVTLRDLNRQFEWELPDENAATIAGLVLHEVRDIPEVGHRFHIHGFLVEILRKHRNQITVLRMVPL